MVEIQSYLEKLICRLRNCFGPKLLYVGLQGSYLRGEATEHSDIDVMVVLEELRVSDLDCYRRVIADLEDPEKACGFICGKEDLAKWNPLEICHLLNSTKDYYGVLCTLVPTYTENDIRIFVKLSVNNLYHEICHRYLYADMEKNIARLPDTYKGVFFILQNLHYLESGVFVPTGKDLLRRLSGKNREVLERAIQFGDGKSYAFPEAFELLLTWCQETLRTA